MSQRKRIGILHFDLMQLRGGDAVCLEMVRTLRDGFDVDVILAHPRVNFEVIRRDMGIELGLKSYRIRSPSRCRILNLLVGPRFGRWKRSWLGHYARRLAGSYDIMVSSYDEFAFPGQGIQYIHFPELTDEKWIRGYVGGQFPLDDRVRWDDEPLDFRFSSFQELYRYMLEVYDPREHVPLDALYSGKKERLFRIYLALWLQYFSTPSQGIDDIRRQVTLVNSDWTGRFFREEYGVQPITLYPPVSTEFPDVPWRDREEGFLYIGQLNPSKRPIKAVEVIESLVRDGIKTHLHVVARDPKSPYTQRFMNAIRSNDYIHLSSGASRVEVRALIDSHRYGIHTRMETFGIGVAEMVMGGMIPFVPAEGGQAEIVAHHPMLTYRTAEELLMKVSQVMGDQTLQAELREHLRAQRDRFAAATFHRRFRDIVEQVLEGSSVEDFESRKASGSQA